VEVVELTHQVCVQQMEVAVTQVVEVHLLIQVHLEQQVMELPTQVVVAVVVQDVAKMVDKVDQVL
tara:strand:- start:8 stop:202 length:195 start_codon:yes stop_codon:yes gene_type:complete